MRILNMTGDDILCSQRYSGSSAHDSSVLSPGSVFSLDISPRCAFLSLQSSHKSESTKPESFEISLSLSLGSSWQAIRGPLDCRWRIYATRSSTRNRCSEFIIFPKRNLASFLSEIPDAVPLHSLLLPGTHDTMAFYGWIISQCQSLETPLQVQLQNGIRVLDIRLAKIEGKLIAYHGVYPEKTPFQTILSAVYEFLTSPISCRETIVMSVKQEDYTSTPPPVFSRLVRDEFASGPGGLGILFLENRIPTLGEVRGKVVLLSRFGGDGAEWEDGLEGMGVHPTIWPDSEKDGFTWECKDVHVRTHDWYAIPSFLYIPEKVSLATKFLLPPPTNGNDDGKHDKRGTTSTRPTLSLVYTSAASFPFAAPRPVAEGFGWPNWGFGVEGVNSRLGKWVLDALSSSLGRTQTQSGSSLFYGSDADMEIGKGIDREKIGVESLVGNGWMMGPRLRGWVLVDFYNQPEHSLLDLLVECNFRGRRTGEEGW